MASVLDLASRHLLGYSIGTHHHAGRHHYRTRAEARAQVFAWIAWYNRFRLHSTRAYLPPIQWEHQHAIISQLPSTTAA
jgi:transposase InsO family protein